MSFDGYELLKLPNQIQTTFDTFTDEVRSYTLDPTVKQKHIFESPLKGFKQRKSKNGIDTAMVWINPLDKNGSFIDYTSPWVNNQLFNKIRIYLVKNMKEQLKIYNAPDNVSLHLTVNYYLPMTDFNITNPVFPFHLDFGFLTMFISDGPTMIYERSTDKWTQINLQGEYAMLQTGALMELYSNHKYKAIPHGVGVSPTIKNNFGKVSIVLTADGTGPLNLYGKNIPITITGEKYNDLSFLWHYQPYQLVNLTRQEEILVDEIAKMNNFKLPY